MTSFTWRGFLCLISLTSSLIQASHQSLPLPVREIYQFSIPTYIEGVYVRSNGDLIVTTVWPNASIYAVCGATTNTPTISLIHAFDEINAVTAILETQPDVFHFIGGNQSTLGFGIHGTYGVWELDLRPANGTNYIEPTIQELVRITDGGFLVALEIVPDTPTTLLVSDSTIGVVWRVDTLARNYELGIQDANMAYPPWGATPFGIDDIHIKNGYLYWSNSYEATVYRIAITDNGYPPAGAVSEVFKAVRALFLDKFSFGPDDGDTIWVAANANSQLVAITSDGDATFVAGVSDQMTLAGPIATAFGKLKGDTNTVYVTTGGGLVSPINGTIIEGGKIVAIDTTGFF
ncbi:hypothetical protein BP5796_12153 [Coleophoma crateriformis]|uniref:SMP-30/Gluconolactonase/LRE-like region domain-containing protein n=1 Tax=Coleophoma crateriformis TaxID=565419 RepID=A0A3D8QBS6_9HELO|nr:hypothetical protein BP5796_12153 [Coleophoma crateriformis]